MYKRILVPVDFTEKSHRALEIACQMAKKLESEVYIMHVVKAALSVYLDELGNYKSKAPAGQKFLEEVLAINESKIRKLINKFDSSGIKMHSKLKVDSNPNEIARLVAEEAFDLTVVGNYEHERFDEVFRRTHPEKIAALAKNPVLIVNNALADFKISKILVPTNLSDDYSSSTQQLIDFAKTFNAEVNFVYINTQANFMTTLQVEKMTTEFKALNGLDKQNVSIFNAKSLKRGILYAADYHESDMIGLFSHHRGNIKNLLVGNITEYLITKSDIPVLTFNLSVRQ
jgi:nucleotide-binding universal stress UspA family protein